MSTTSARESAILSTAEEFLAKSVEMFDAEVRDEARVQILEGTAAELAGYCFEWYQSAAGSGDRYGIDRSLVQRQGRQLSDRLKSIGIHPALALASLASPPLSKSEKRRGGAYYTDWRLAEFLAAQLRLPPKKPFTILDPASGTGILLVAAALAARDSSRRYMSRVIGDSIFAADLSKRALRGAALALSSLCDDRGAIRSLLRHLRQGDSLQESKVMWSDVAPDGFDIVLGNPPWEKLKVSRHEFLLANGVKRHYGSDYGAICREDFDKEQAAVRTYVRDVQSDFYLQGSGEPDFYKLFIELAIKLVRNNGSIALYVPAGLIRSLGTKRLRQFILEKSVHTSFTVLENRARFFPIDTRFKFVLLHVNLGELGRKGVFTIAHATGDSLGVKAVDSVAIERKTLTGLRPDLSIPEVRTAGEWKLFRSVCLEHTALGNQTGCWVPSFMREVDMTRDRKNFLHEPGPDAIPLIEGRMVHQYRHAVKQYAGGRGRSATWEPAGEGLTCEFKPQFWYPLKMLPASVRKRIEISRVGFCDIAGQTNERTMLSARVPAGVVCGNKVPTIVFPFAGSFDDLLQLCWLAIANSFVFDWLLRRVVTTTVNYFLLLGLPMPKLDLSSAKAAEIGELVSRITACTHESGCDNSGRLSPWQEAEIRCELECRVLGLYGLGLNELRLILEDFPLLDRAQPALPGEQRSTITRDFVFWNFSTRYGGRDAKSEKVWGTRVQLARASGAVPFVPSHLGDAQVEICFDSGNEEGTHAPRYEETGSGLFSRSVAG